MNTVSNVRFDSRQALKTTQSNTKSNSAVTVTKIKTNKMFTLIK